MTCLLFSFVILRAFETPTPATRVISKHESGKEVSGWEEGAQHNGVRTGKDGGRGEVNKNNLWKNAVTKPITLYDTITYKK